MNSNNNYELIEEINAHGPYAHGLWNLGETLRDTLYQPVGNEEALEGRAYFLAETVKNTLAQRFTLDEISTLTLVDIGCYDGWLLCQLEALPFKRLIGVEPRKKNIDKGHFIRKITGIKTRAEFVEGGIEELASLDLGEIDVVLCTGLFHHLPSTYHGVKALRDICGKFLFLETIVLSDDLLSEAVKSKLELKDIPYRLGAKEFGFSGHKVESNYYDGSSSQLGVIEIHSKNALLMQLKYGGFPDAKIEVDIGDYSAIFRTSHREFSSVCITANRAYTPATIDMVSQYESGILFQLIPIEILKKLHSILLLEPAKASRNCSETIKSHEQFLTNVQQEIISNLAYAPHEKLDLEFSKHCLLNQEFEAAKQHLYSITRRENADWRSVYRAFAILSWLDFASENSSRYLDETSRSERLALVANPQFPKDLLSKKGYLSFLAYHNQHR